MIVFSVVPRVFGSIPDPVKIRPKVKFSVWLKRRSQGRPEDLEKKVGKFPGRAGESSQSDRVFSLGKWQEES